MTIVSMKPAPRMEKAASPLQHARLVEAYAKVEGRDWLLEQIVGIIIDSNLSLKYIERHCGVCSSTIWKWINGETKRPQLITIRMVLNTLGYDLKIVRANYVPRQQTQNIFPMPKARPRKV